MEVDLRFEDAFKTRTNAFRDRQDGARQIFEGKKKCLWQFAKN